VLAFLTVLATLSQSPPQVPASKPPQADLTRESKPDLPASAWTRDVCFLDASTIVLADALGHSHTSFDGGRTWKSAKMGTVVDALVVDAREVLWGLDRPQGIDETSPPALVWSQDDGLTWRKHELDPKVCVPVDFVEGTLGSLLLAADGQLWMIEPVEGGAVARMKAWGRPNPDVSAVSAIRFARNSFLVSSASGVWSTTDDARTWLRLAEKPVVGFFGPTFSASCGSGVGLWCGYTRRGELLTFRVEGSLIGAKVSSVALAQIGQPLDGVGSVLHCAGGERFYICGERKDGQALGACGDRQLKMIYPSGLAGKQAVRVRVGADGQPWLVGKGVYRLSLAGDRWDLVWPKP